MATPNADDACDAFFIAVIGYPMKLCVVERIKVARLGGERFALEVKSLICVAFDLNGVFVVVPGVPARVDVWRDTAARRNAGNQHHAESIPANNRHDELCQLLGGRQHL